METKGNATKPAETKPMTLQDLGLEDETTPAEKAQTTFIDAKSGSKIEQKSFINAEDAVEKPKMKIPRPETIQRTSSDMQTQHLTGDTRPTVTINGHQPAKNKYQETQSIARPVDPSVYAVTEEEKKQANVQMTGLTRGDDAQDAELTVISNLDKIAPRKKQENPIQKTMNHLHGMVDKGIQRTENEMLAVDGRIQEGKEKYVEYRYATLMERAKQSPTLKKKIEYYQRAMETDPSFDDATDYMKKGFILFKVANDTSIGITDKSFGLAQESIKGYRSSKETTKAIQETVESAAEEREEENDSQVIIGEGHNDGLLYGDADIPVRKSTDTATSADKTGVEIKPTESLTNEDETTDVHEDSSVRDDGIPTRKSTPTVGFPDDDEEEKKEETKPATSTKFVPAGGLMAKPASANANSEEAKTEHSRVDTPPSDPEELVPLSRAIDDVDIDDDLGTDPTAQQSETMRLYGLSDEDYRAMEMDYLKEASRVLNVDANLPDLTSMESAKAVNLNTALQLMKQQDTISSRHTRTIWPLMFTGIPAETTSLSGIELSQFIDDLNAGFVPTRDNPNPQPTMTQLRSVFTAMYSHFMNPGKPDFNAWLNRISSNDFYNLIFAQYNAHFKHTNYLSYQCPKHGCAKLFLEKKPIMDMVTFPNDATKERFEAIQRRDSVLTNLYRTEPVAINEFFAISFRTPSVYGMLFEQASLTKSYKEKYNSIISLLPMIDAFWIVDRRNGRKHPIDFGVVKNDLEKTVMRKVNGILKIMSTFNTDQRSIIYGEYLKIVKSMQVDDVSYQIPGTKCPVCGTEIPAEPADPIGLLFMRARLSIEAASTPALL